MAHYIYAGEQYDTEAELNAAIVAMKNALDDQPTTYCQIKALTGNATDGWTIPEATLTDQEIINPNANSFYSAYSPYDGQTYLGLTSDQMLDKVFEFMVAYGQYIEANTVYKVSAPTNVDMSGYV